MRSWMLGNMDSELHRLAQRAESIWMLMMRRTRRWRGGDADASADGDDGTRTMSQSGGRGPRPGGPVIPDGPTDPASAGLAFPRAHSSM